MTSIRFLQSLIVTALFFSFSVNADETKFSPSTTSCKEVPFRILSAREYANFPVWDQKISPKLYAYIRTLEEYKKSFHGVFFPGKKPSPPASLFETNHIVAVALTMKAVAPEQWDQTFTVEKVENCEGQLSLHFRINPFTSIASWTQSNSLTIAIEKSDFEQVVFHEAGAEPVTLDLTAGQWRHPTLD